MDLLNATLSARIDLTATISRFRVRPDEGPPDFRPGQYLALGLADGDRLLQRPYSAASSPGRGSEVEFLIRRVDGGALTPRLWASPPGLRLRLGRPKGLFALQPDDPRTHLFVATGTGIAPFMAMLAELRARSRPPRAIVVHGVSHPAELAYRDDLEGGPGRTPDITYVPTVSRPADPGSAGWTGRTGRVETIVESVIDGHGVDSATTIAYLCGNPEMIDSVGHILAARGFPADGITSEHYWPAATSREAPRAAS
jgi:ferredoxin--NADP+ reductase